ncbi:hypothetical protein [Roseibium sp. RKSG952]|uniref:hypothetical protein n=1 Tax=Roseibium sp. RKSG952 TaxID=2529384 RepID=UPI0012BD4518|nr:hypothetical protein [Roseibium sp. RKSG952]MTI01070.1 hypothetical protein [Roseibium sp. RKSG952]
MAKLLYKVAGAAMAVLVAVSAANAATLTNMASNNGGPVENLGHQTINSPIVGPSTPHHARIYADTGSPLKTQLVKYNGPQALKVSPSSDVGYTNVGTNNGGVIVPNA